MPKSKSTPPPKTKREDTIEKSLGNLGQSQTWQYKSKKDFEHQNGKMAKMCEQGKWQKKRCP